jgi:hypothetical protein
MVVVNTGGQARHPAATEQLMRYWAEGEGAARIRWGTEGDHTRCTRLINEEITKKGKAPLPPDEIHGLCTNLQKRATGSAHDKFDNPKGNRGHD